MDNQQNEYRRPMNPRRRKRTKAQIFKEAYLPVVIAAAALMMILIFIIGSITRAVQKHQAEEQASMEASIAVQKQEAALALEEQELLAQAQKLAAGYDYEGAINVLDSFSGQMSLYPTLTARREEYAAAKSELVAWDDPSKIVNLSFQLLLADLQMGLKYEAYANTINRSFVTTGEFSKILQQLYDNGYILVSTSDFIAEDHTAKTLYLPAGKKPLVLTQTNVNYNYYLIDSDGDKLADKNGGGFASKLMVDGSGNFTCQMTDSNGQTVTGDYDLVPILERFIDSHPDFSYGNARAVLALTGYNGLFGCRTENENAQDAVQEASALAQALVNRGYELACYTYENIPYGSETLENIRTDLDKWNSQVAPILGSIDILVYAQQSDIASTTGTYSGERFDLLQAAGFRYYMGFCENGKSWTSLQNGYVRQGRILVSGSSMAHHPEWFAGLFDASSILDPARGEVPA